MNRPKCRFCGKKIPKRTENVYAPRMSNRAWPVPNWTYSGKKIVTSKRYIDVVMEETRERRLDHVSVWDGESYSPTYGYFCSGTCAGSFARTVVALELRHS